MSSKYMKKASSLESFSNILSSFTGEILRNQPKDIIDFAINYFKCLEEKTILDYPDKGQNIPCDYKPRIPRIPTMDKKTQESSIYETNRNTTIQSARSTKSDKLMKGGGEIIEPDDEIEIMQGGGTMKSLTQSSFNKSLSNIQMVGGGEMGSKRSSISSLSIMKGGGIMEGESKGSTMSIMKGGGVMENDSKRSSISIMKGGGVMDGDSKRSSISIMKGGGVMDGDN